MKRLKGISFALIIFIAVSALGLSTEEICAASKGKVKYIAHRGLSARAPENTLAAFRLAARNKGFYGVELDIWESSAQKTGKPLLLVMHDPDTGRMCGKKTKITSITRASRKNYTIKNGNGIKKYKGQKIPTAYQALREIYKYSKGAIPVIELKHRFSKRALSYLFDLIGDREAVIISFEWNAVRDAARMARERGVNNKVTTMYLKEKVSADKRSTLIKKMKNAGISAISLKYTGVSAKAVKAYHKSGLEVCTWTLPNKKQARRIANMGADYITSNDALF